MLEDQIKHYPGRKFVRPSTKDMITEQVKVLKSVGCEDYFFSREDKTPYIMMRFCKAVDLKLMKTNIWLLRRIGNMLMRGNHAYKNNK